MIPDTFPKDAKVHIIYVSVGDKSDSRYKENKKVFEWVEKQAKKWGSAPEKILKKDVAGDFEFFAKDSNDKRLYKLKMKGVNAVIKNYGMAFNFGDPREYSQERMEAYLRAKRIPTKIKPAHIFCTFTIRILSETNRLHYADFVVQEIIEGGRIKSREDVELAEDYYDTLLLKDLYVDTENLKPNFIKDREGQIWYIDEIRIREAIKRQIREVVWGRRWRRIKKLWSWLPFLKTKNCQNFLYSRTLSLGR